MTVILDLDLHAIWQECSGIPTPPPCLATDSENSRQIPSDEGEPAGDETSGSSVIECLFHPTYEKLSAFSDLFLYMSAFAFSNEVHWVETRLVLFDRKPGESIGEHLFFLPRVETALGNLCRVRGQLLDTIHDFGAIGNSFRLSLQPRIELLQYSSQSTLSPLGTLPTTLSLDPEFFVHKILGGYK
ncbi:unnamed protein product [Penicillium roqueforti FM164]|uniref:Uncharacterized protein n=1 Tax=Penicillium roqueforti (strain FM164) TaxID=1365484 RepID=W6QRG2_PENRF|nr:unnamed protein product [Penicillium roqueforti FM164]